MNTVKRDIPAKTTATAIALLVSLSGAVHAENALKTMNFVTHAAYFSGETQQTTPLDPHVFLTRADAPAATGPQGIKHVAGLRNALITDAPDLPILNANGQSLGMSLGDWLSAKGRVTLSPLKDGRETVTVTLSALKPNGSYSLFENHFDEKPVGFTPLDGKGTQNNFVASAKGEASITVIAPAVLTHNNAVLVVYHSDGSQHGMSRGAIGIDAHHQLIARP